MLTCYYCFLVYFSRMLVIYSYCWEKQNFLWIWHIANKKLHCHKDSIQKKKFDHRIRWVQRVTILSTQLLNWCARLYSAQHNVYTLCSTHCVPSRLSYCTLSIGLSRFCCHNTKTYCISNIEISKIGKITWYQSKKK